MTQLETLNIASSVEQPTRLSEKTRSLARRGLSGEFGKKMINSQVKLEDHISTEGLSEERKYSLAVKLIAETAPLRILPDELIVGSSTYKEAPFHLTPIFGINSTSHLTLGFDRIIEIGYKGLEKEIKKRLSQSDLDDEGVDLLNSMLICLDATRIWHQRHVDLLKKLIEESSGTQKKHYAKVLKNITLVPENDSSFLD